jgi:hypothetical protein
MVRSTSFVACFWLKFFLWCYFEPSILCTRWEKYDAKGWTEKGAHKYGRLNEQSWWERWGEHYDGRGFVLKWCVSLTFQHRLYICDTVLNPEYIASKSPFLYLPALGYNKGFCRFIQCAVAYQLVNCIRMHVQLLGSNLLR